jgi:hypothetical protein
LSDDVLVASRNGGFQVFSESQVVVCVEQHVSSDRVSSSFFIEISGNSLDVTPSPRLLFAIRANVESLPPRTIRMIPRYGLVECRVGGLVSHPGCDV